MHDIETALSDIDRIRDQLAASTRFRGFTPSIAATTGLLALALATAQSLQPGLANDIRLYFAAWILLAIICACLIGTDAVVRARALHRGMAESMIGTTLRQFGPAGAAGAVCALVLLVRAPDAAWLLPGLWQLLIALGIFAALSNLPRRMIWAAGCYFLCGSLTLALSSAMAAPSPWAMGIPFGFGQLLAAAILHDAGKRGGHG